MTPSSHREAMVVLAALLLAIPASRADDLACLTKQQRASAVLYARLQLEAVAALERRTEALEQAKSREQIGAYQQRLREFFVKQLGGFPERTPLDARTVRTIEADGYRIENVIFASRPRHHITANLYLPRGAGPFPGIVVSSGHSRTAKTADYNQRFGIILAKHGMAALCFDPIGQGERSQILNAEGRPQFEGTTTEHFLISVGSILVGRNTATYRVWDAMRAIDYLVSRPEIDPKRIGMAGCSGGGTLTSYVMALDERVACAAPACYLTTFRRLIETIGPQDAEQNVFGQVAFGLDQPDYVLLRAPRPTLISATTDDFFDIRGTWDNFRQAKRIYGRLGFPERVDLVEVDGKHGVQPQNLATIAHWMQRWLLGRDQTVPIGELRTRPANELLCTTSGQMLHLRGERSVFDLNTQREAELAAQRRDLWKTQSPKAMAAKIRDLVGAQSNERVALPKWDHVGRVERDGYQIDKLVLHMDSGVLLPALVFRPKSPRDDVYLYLHDDGKAGDSARGGPIEQLIGKGFTVVTVDLRGQGETAAGRRDPQHGDWKTFYLAYLLGKSLTGMRVEDALAAGKFAAAYERPKDSPRRVHLVGAGQAGIVALHAGALHLEVFASVTLRKTARDWASIVRQPNPLGQLESVVHGALGIYDLPDLLRVVGEGKVRYDD
jgi:cephalosporin-C deacetylase-like acetyl esterase